MKCHESPDGILTNIHPVVKEFVDDFMKQHGKLRITDNPTFWKNWYSEKRWFLRSLDEYFSEKMHDVIKKDKK